jgi:hypothetical protein
MKVKIKTSIFIEIDSKDTKLSIISQICKLPKHISFYAWSVSMDKWRLLPKALNFKDTYK